jgi:hypothetical protein
MRRQVLGSTAPIRSNNEIASARRSFGLASRHQSGRCSRYPRTSSGDGAGALPVAVGLPVGRVELVVAHETAP